MCEMAAMLEIIERLRAGPVIDTSQRRNTGSLLLPLIEKLTAVGVPIGRMMSSVYVTDDMGECFFRSYPVYSVGDTGRLILDGERERLLCAS